MLPKYHHHLTKMKKHLGTLLVVTLSYHNKQGSEREHLYNSSNIKSVNKTYGEKRTGNIQSELFK